MTEPTAFDDFISTLGFDSLPDGQRKEIAADNALYKASQREATLAGLLDEVDLDVSLSEIQAREAVAARMGSEILKSVLLHEGTKRFNDEDWTELSEKEKLLCEKMFSALASLVHDERYQAMLKEEYKLVDRTDFDFSPREDGPIMQGARDFIEELESFCRQKELNIFTPPETMDTEEDSGALETVFSADNFTGVSYMSFLLKKRYTAYEHVVVRNSALGQVTSFDSAFIAEAQSYVGYAIAHNIYTIFIDEVSGRMPQAQH